MFKRILVPVNFIESNHHAMQIALKMLSDSHSQLVVLHVIELIADTQVEEYQDFYQQLYRRAEAQMTQFLTPYQQETGRIVIAIEYGSRVKHILDFAGQQNMEAIVMSSRRIDPAHPMKHWGTISQKVGILAQCPVMLVK